MAQQFTKQPREVVDYDIDMSAYFEGLGVDQIASAVLEIDNVTVPPLELGPGVHPDHELVGDPAHLLKIWTGGGLTGSKYTITALITTDDGRVEELEFVIKVKEKS